MPSAPDLPTAEGLRDMAGDALGGAVAGVADQAASMATGAYDAAQGAAGAGLDAVMSAGAGAASAATGAASAAAGLNVDDLARRLFDPLVARIKTELRLDRERAGYVTDLRR